jgi:hypothetical protein
LELLSDGFIACPFPAGSPSRASESDMFADRRGVYQAPRHLQRTIMDFDKAIKRYKTFFSKHVSPEMGKRRFAMSKGEKRRAKHLKELIRLRKMEKRLNARRF